jgi:hypothetical protein
MTESNPATEELSARGGAKGSSFRKPMFFGPESAEWKEFEASTPEGADDETKKTLEDLAKAAKSQLKDILLSSLQMQHIVVLAGSGTSLGSPIDGPSMRDLWDHCVHENPGTGEEERSLSLTAKAVIEAVGYDFDREGLNIESLLSRCEAYGEVADTVKKRNEEESHVDVSAFVTQSKKVILEKCSQFIDVEDPDQLSAHRTFLHRLSRRRVRDSRLKLFTTNYDLCFETAAGRQGLVVLDGFSFTQPRHFDPHFFLYDIVRRPTTGEEVGTPLEGVFHLYKLHGSVNWLRKNDTVIEVCPTPDADSACLIYPAKGKYQQSYIQPHLELISQYLSALREPNTCLMVLGFGFNDDHLSEPILAAVRSNPHLRLIIVNPSAEDLTERPEEENKYWEALFQAAKQGEDVWLINADFGKFAELIPDLKSLTPAQRLTRDIRQVAGTL